MAKNGFLNIKSIFFMIIGLAILIFSIVWFANYISDIEIKQITNEDDKENNQGINEEPEDLIKTFGSINIFNIEPNSKKQLSDKFFDLSDLGNSFKFVGVTNGGGVFDVEYPNYREAFGSLSRDTGGCAYMTKMGTFPDYEYYQIENSCDEPYTVSFYY